MLVFGPTLKPAKRLVYLALRRDSGLSIGRQVGADFGCKGMKYRRLFRTQEYYGVDLDGSALERGLALYPEAIAIESKIEDMNLPPVDFGVCVNVFGATNFENSDPDEVVERIAGSIAKNGTLLMTLKNKDNRYNLERHVDQLKKAFRDVDIMPLPLDNRRSLLAHLKARYCLHQRPHVEQPKRIYCRCTGRR